MAMFRKLSMIHHLRTNQNWSRERTADTVTRLQAGKINNHGSIPDKVKSFFSLGFGSQSASSSRVPAALTSGGGDRGKPPETKADH
jgi:hypothetical protein